MQVIAIILLLFGGVGFIASLYALFTVKSPILASQDDVKIGALSLQAIFNIIFIYFSILHVMFVLIGVGFLIG
jgi:hypothetical protein